MASPAPSSGRPLEAGGNLRSRGVTVLERLRAYRPARPRSPPDRCVASSSERWERPYRQVDPQGGSNMRAFAGIVAAAIVIAACGGPAAVSTPTPTPTPTASPSPTPVPTVSNVFKADLKSANEKPPIDDAVATCVENATVHPHTTLGMYDVLITGF